MDDSKGPLPQRDPEREAETKHLEELLNEGLDDLASGRTVSRDEMRREIEAIFSAHKAKQTGPKRR
jgi:hypothetical protein